MQGLQAQHLLQQRPDLLVGQTAVEAEEGHLSPKVMTLPAGLHAEAAQEEHFR